MNEFEKAMNEIRHNRNFLDNLEIVRNEYAELEAEIERLRWKYPDRGELPSDYEKCVVEHPYTVYGKPGGNYAYTVCLWMDETDCFWIMNFTVDGFQPTILHDDITRWRYV